jgi:low temperature requirement protein LtrA
MAAMAASDETGGSRLGTTLREGERVTPLELFFDLVFVLAITQCTALMSHHPTWSGIAQGLLVLGMLWWAWTGYSWLTSVIDPEEGAVRLVMFGAMAALLLVCSVCRKRLAAWPSPSR